MPTDQSIQLTEIQTIKLLKHGFIDREASDGPIVAVATGTDKVGRLIANDVQTWTFNNAATLQRINDVSKDIGGTTIDPTTVQFSDLSKRKEHNSESLTPIPPYLQKTITKESRHNPTDYIPTQTTSDAHTWKIGLSARQTTELLGKGYMEQAPADGAPHVIVEAKLVNGILLRDNVEKWTFANKLDQYSMHHIATELNISAPDPNKTEIQDITRTQANTTEALHPLPQIATEKFNQKIETTSKNNTPPKILITQIPNDPTPEKLQQWQDTIKNNMDGIEHIRIIGSKTPQSSHAESLLKHTHINATIEHITPEGFQRMKSHDQQAFVRFASKKSKMINMDTNLMTQILHTSPQQQATTGNNTVHKNKENTR